MRHRLCVFSVAIFFWAQPAAAQSLAADVHFAIARWGVGLGPESDYGVGGRVTWKPSSMIGLDANVAWYPNGFPGDTAAPVSDQRFEGLFGVTAGPRLGAVRPFAKAAAGFLMVGAARELTVCIAIFPPPISCTLAGGTTLPAYELGGGLEIDATSRMFLRGDVSARFLRFPGPALDADFQVRDADYYEPGLRVTIGAGVRF